jgi:hypothetical protein
MVSSIGEGSAEHSLVLYSSAHTSYWPKLSRDLQIAISEKNYLFLQKVGWISHYKSYKGMNVIQDQPETFYLALIKKQGGKTEHVAHFKIAPKGEVTEAIAENHFKAAAEQLITFEAARSGFAIFSPNNREDNKDYQNYLLKKKGYYSINNSKDAAEIIQFCGDKKYVLPLLLGIYMIGTYPKESIQNLRIPVFRKNRTPSREEMEEGEQAKDNFLNIFKQRIFYGTSGASSAPHLFITGLNKAFNLWEQFKTDGLSDYINTIIQKNNPYETDDLENRDKWEEHTKKLWKETLNLWESHMRKVTEKKTRTKEDFKEAHHNFIQNISQINSVASFIAEVVGIDPFSLGPILSDLNQPEDYYRAFLWPPFALSTKEPYHFGAEMFKQIYEYVHKELSIDFSQVHLVGPTLKPVFPEGYHESFCRQQLDQAESLKDHLTLPVEGASHISNYRVNLSPEVEMAMNYHKDWTNNV